MRFPAKPRCGTLNVNGNAAWPEFARVILRSSYTEITCSNISKRRGRRAGSRAKVDSIPTRLGLDFIACIVRCANRGSCDVIVQDSLRPRAAPARR
ncbi:unnamed protein product, partial [Iphiclides podalirius]